MKKEREARLLRLLNIDGGSDSRPFSLSEKDKSRKGFKLCVEKEIRQRGEVREQVRMKGFEVIIVQRQRENNANYVENKNTTMN